LNLAVNVGGNARKKTKGMKGDNCLPEQDIDEWSFCSFQIHFYLFGAMANGSNSIFQLPPATVEFLFPVLHVGDDVELHFGTSLDQFFFHFSAINKKDLPEFSGRLNCCDVA
jgi:hypothetical protein